MARLAVKITYSSSHEEGAARDFSVLTKEFVGKEGQVEGVRCIHVDDKMQPIADSSFVLKADLVLLAMGFVSPVHEGLVEQSGVALDGRGNVSADTRTIIPQKI